MIQKILENHLLPKEDYIFGFADLRGLLPEKYSDFRFGISIGKRLDDVIINKLIDGPTIEYFRHYKDVNSQLAGLTAEIQNELTSNNVSSLPVMPTVSLSSGEGRNYLKSLTYDISHKMVATRAGLGWIGKSDLLITKEFGPRLRLVTVLLKEDPGCKAKPVNKSRCGDCNVCVIKCPAKAASGLHWDVTMHRDVFFNAFKCREKCGELAKQVLNVDEHICGLCIRVCPVGKARKI